VWHDGLLFKIKKNLPIQYFVVLQSYLRDRHFIIKQNDATSQLYKILAGVPQGSVLDPVRYLLYMADLPTTNGVLTATFADDTALLAAHKNHTTASKILQEVIDTIQHWIKKWRIKLNEAKSTHVTFTTCRDTCPSIVINGQPIPQADVAKYLDKYLDRRLTWGSVPIDHVKGYGHGSGYKIMCIFNNFFLYKKVIYL